MSRFCAVAAVLVLALLVVPQASPQAPDKVAPDKAKTPPPQSLSSEIGGKTFEQWKMDLKHPDPSVRAEAIVMVTEFGALAAETVPLLLDRCLDRDASPRVKAIIALTIIDVPPKDVPRVVDCLGKRLEIDTQSIVRYQAAVALQRFADDPAAKAAITGLILAAADTTSWEIRRMGVNILRRAGRDPKNGPEPRVTMALIRATKDQTVQVRIEAAIALGVLGRPGDPTLLATVENVLVGLTRDKDKVVSVWAQFSLLALSATVPEARVEGIAKNLKANEARLRMQTARVLGTMGDKARTCIPELIDALDDKDKDVAAEACLALGQIPKPGARAEAAIEELSKRKDADEGLKEVAATVLEQLKKPPEKKPPEKKPPEKKPPAKP